MADPTNRAASESASPRAFHFKNEGINFADIEFQYRGKSSSNILPKLIGNELERQKRIDVKTFSSNLLEQKLARRLGNPRHFNDLKNPLKRIKISGESDEMMMSHYFERWSRAHTFYCHYNPISHDANSMVYHVIFDESGQFVLSASVDGLIKIFNKNFELVHTIRGHKRDISILAVSSNNKFVVSVDESGIARVWNFPSGR